MASRANSSPYGVRFSDALGGASGVSDGAVVALGDGDGTGGKALAITARILAMVTAFKRR
jgi:hypothetical protein